ncbi:hypothetical protein Tco_0082085, partial [Tanacetum coccineum]
QRFNDEYDNIVVDGLISFKSQDVDHISKKSFVMDDPEFIAKDNEEGSYFDTFLSTQQDVGVSESMDVKTVVVPFQHQKYPYKTCVSPYVPPPLTKVKSKKRRRVMKLDKLNIVIRTLIGPNGNEIPLLPRKEACVYKLRQRMDMQWTFPWLENGHVIRMDFWEKLVGRSHTKRGRLYDDHLDI